MDDKEFFSWEGCWKNRGQGLVHTTTDIFIFDNIRNSFLTQRWFEKENAICPLWIALLLSGAIRLKDKKLSSK